MMPYRDDCPNCAAVRAYWSGIDEHIRTVARNTSIDTVLGITINAEEVPMCNEHLETRSVWHE
jgi:hypothetical protein